MQFLAELALVHADVNVAQREFRRVNIDERLGGQLAIGCDAFQRPCVVRIPGQVRCYALVDQLLALVGTKRGTRLEVVLAGSYRTQDSRTGSEVGLDQRRFRIAECQRIVLMGVVEREHRLEFITRRGDQLDAASFGVVLVVTLPGDRILDEAVVAGAHQRSADAPGRVDRCRRVRLGFEQAEVSGGQFDLALGTVTGFAGDDLDRAARRILSVQGALWTTQHFDVIDVVEAEQGALDA